MADTPNTQNDSQEPNQGPAAQPSFGLPPETPTMPGTTDHIIEPGAENIKKEVAAPPTDTQDNIIMPEHDVPRLTPSPTPAPTNTTPIPQTPNTTPLPPFPNTTQVPPPPLSEPMQGSTLQDARSNLAESPASPLRTSPPQRTSMYEARVHEVESASPKDYGIVPEKKKVRLPPTPPTQRPSAQDMLYESALGKPLEGPVIPSSRPKLSQAPQPQQPSVPPPTNSPRLDPSILATQATPSEMSRDAKTARQATPPIEQPAFAPPQSAFAPPQSSPERTQRTVIRTLESDVASTVAQKRLSVSGIALAQQQQAAAATASIPNEKHFSWWALSGIILAVLGVGVVTVAYLMQTRAPDIPPIVTTPENALIPGVSETTLDITGMQRTDMLRALTALTPQYAAKSGISLVRLITFTEERIDGETVRTQSDVPAERFFTQLSTRAGNRLYRALGAQSYFGVVSIDGRALPFLAFETTSYDSAFAGMLEWEALILDDLPFLTYTPPPPPQEPAPIATTTPGGTSTTPIASAPVVINVSPTTPTFIDIVVKNKDARVVRNSDGSTRLLYAFPTQTILLIAQNEEVLATLVEHLTTARFSR